MAEKEQWITNGRLPVDVSADEMIHSGPITYDPGMCRFKCLGWYNNPKGKGKSVVMGFLITDGPDDRHSNKGRTYRKTYNLEVGSKSRGFYRALVHGIAGEKGFVKGEVDFGVIGGAEFDAMLFEKDSTYEDKKTGQMKTGKNYEIDDTTIKNVKLGNGVAAGGGTSGGGGGFEPAT